LSTRPAACARRVETRVGAGTGQAGGCLILDFAPHSRDTLTRECLIFPRVCGTRLDVLSCECGIYFMKSGIDRHEVRSESEILVSLEFGESSE
jgi:hypothetical protein